VLPSEAERDRGFELGADPRRDAGSCEFGPSIGPLVDGEPGGGSGPPALLVDPATGEPFARITYAVPEDLDRAVESASRACALWRGMSFEERSQRLRRLAELIRTHADSIAQLVAREQGKPYVEALALEVLPALDHLSFIVQHAEWYRTGLVLAPRHPFYAHKQAHYLYEAIGVIALITPSSLPFAIPLIQTAAALVMGNSVVLKPSERTPLSGLYIGDLCRKAGFPDGLVNVVPALPSDTLHLVVHRRVDKVLLTGGLTAGQAVMAAAGRIPRPVVLQLGGKHPSIVAGDADVERAARGIVWGALANCGQNCGAVERVYVEESIAARFLECLLAAVDRVRMGNPLEEGIDLGPLLHEGRRQRVHGQVMEAVNGGARLVRGGILPSGPGFFYPPTVVLDPPLDGDLMREETLGPVIPIVVVESLERAILLANDSEYALTASGWTTSADKAERMMAGLRAGVVTINDVLYSFGEPASTWSGYRKSGIGQNHGTPGLREMSQQRFVSFDPSGTEGPVFGFPYDAAGVALAEQSLRYLHGHRLQRIGGLLRLFGLPRFRSRVPVRSFLFGARRRVK
jgi:acyl-CoA reductase-like NAD-dependent aldehyde dehydrogenase